MANQRAKGKKLIGAQASAELWAGVDAWLAKNPNATVSEFVLKACVEKLAREGIEIDKDEALRDRRGRMPSVAVASSAVAPPVVAAPPPSGVEPGSATEPTAPGPG